MFISMILLVLIFVATAKTYSSSRKGEPTGLGKFTEPLIMFIKDEVAMPMIGEKNYHKYMPFLLTLFFFIWINNVMGLIPFFPFNKLFDICLNIYEFTNINEINFQAIL